MLNATAEARFWSYVLKGADCWLYQRSRTPFGYGVFCANNTRYVAHRVSYELCIGHVPPEMLVCHRCDNPPCVNPAHLFIGTARDNHLDCRAKGRYRNGSPSYLKDPPTHCRNGHLLVPENVSTLKSGRQNLCRLCSVDRVRQYRARRRAAERLA